MTCTWSAPVAPPDDGRPARAGEASPRIQLDAQHLFRRSGTRVLGVPCVADRIAQTVAAARLEKAVEPVFHPDSYGYRPGRSQLDAVEACRERCWESNWIVDLDIRKFFDSVRWDLIVKAVEKHTDHETRWIVLYVKRWLAAPLQLPGGALQERDRGTPQGSAISPILTNLFMHVCHEC
jgi:RNA-directed DNA polymerase